MQNKEYRGHRRAKINLKAIFPITLPGDYMKLNQTQQLLCKFIPAVPPLFVFKLSYCFGIRFCCHRMDELGDRYILDTTCGENQNTHFIFNNVFFFKLHRL
jgi:hypothetical protein